MDLLSHLSKECTLHFAETSTQANQLLTASRSDTVKVSTETAFDLLQDSCIFMSCIVLQTLRTLSASNSSESEEDEIFTDTPLFGGPFSEVRVIGEETTPVESINFTETSGLQQGGGTTYELEETELTLYSKILKSLRFSSTCITQLSNTEFPTTQPDPVGTTFTPFYTDGVPDILLILKWNVTLSANCNEGNNLCPELLFPINSIPLAIVLFHNSNSNFTYIARTQMSCGFSETCANDTDAYLLHLLKLQTPPKKVARVDSLRNFWNQVHHNLWSGIQEQGETENRLKSVLQFISTNPRHKDSFNYVVRILLNLHNCTGIKCKQYISKNLHFLQLLLSKTFSYDCAFWTFSTYFEGYNFIVFSGSKSLKINTESLFEPISWVGWLVIIVTIGALGVILHMTGLQNTSLWMLSVSLEQDITPENKYVNVRNFYLVILWSHAANLLRNTYTSSMYSVITKEIPPYIPSSITQLLVDSVYPSFVVTNDMTHLLVSQNSEFDEANQLLPELTSVLTYTTMAKSLVTFHPCTISTDRPRHEFIQNVSHFNPISCTRHFIESDDSEDGEFLGADSVVSSYTVPETFAIITNIENEVWTKLYFSGSREGKLFDSSQKTETIPEVFMAYVNQKKNFILEMLHYDIASLVEAGIYGWVFQFMIRSQSIQKVMQSSDNGPFSENNRTWKRMNINAMFFSSSGITRSKGTELKATTVKDVIIIWILFLICITISGTMFIIEMSWNAKEKNENCSAIYIFFRKRSEITRENGIP
ncbi:unnamed protein product [Orchesella dallaii]|uniref:Uncharacterized protein n=1 Tax=Orchesella dallaii TaxID=48710 RepID=A0ABP1S1B5_9HEXA